MPVMPQGVVLMMASKRCLASSVLLEDVGLGLARQGDGFLVGAVDDEDLRALLDEAEDRSPGRAACAEHENARALEAHAPLQRANDAGHVGIEAVELAVGAGAQRVACADAAR